jgi:hypothetical protein
MSAARVENNRSLGALRVLIAKKSVVSVLLESKVRVGGVRSAKTRRHVYTSTRKIHGTGEKAWVYLWMFVPYWWRCRGLKIDSWIGEVGGWAIAVAEIESFCRFAVAQG